MFFVAERAADIAQMRVMRIDLNDRTAGVAVRVVVGIGYCLAFVSCKSSKDHSKPRNEVDTSLKSPV